MHFNQLKKNFRQILDTGISVELISPPGVGKSTFVEEMVGLQSKQDNEPWGMSVMFLATQTPPDLIGYIMKGEMPTAQGNIPVSQPTLPGWMITQTGKPVWEYKRGVLLLDEYGQGEADVKRASAELLLNKRLGPWRLPPGWSVIACSNRASDRSGVTKSFDFVINRRMEIHVEPHLASFEDWAFKNNIHPMFITFANQNPQIVFSGAVPEKQGPWCTPRSLVMLARLMDAFTDENGKLPTDIEASELASGIIGEAATAQLMTFIALGNDMPSYEEIVAKPDKVKVPDRPDTRMLVCYNLAARVGKDDAGPVIKFVERMPKEFGVTFAKTACRRNPNLVYQDAFEKWSEANSGILAAIVDG